MDQPLNGPQASPQGVSAGQPLAAMADKRLVRLGELLQASPHSLLSQSQREAVDDHLVESLLVAQAMRADGRWLDLGTGGGLPGLVLAMTHPRVTWVLLDATRKKVEFVRDAAVELGLANVVALWGRAEDVSQLPEHASRYDGVVARAVAPLDRLIPLAWPFLQPDGQIIAIKGPKAQEELEHAREELCQRRLVSTRIVLAEAPRPTTLVIMRRDAARSAGRRDSERA